MHFLAWLARIGGWWLRLFLRRSEDSQPRTNKAPFTLMLAAGHSSLQRSPANAFSIMSCLASPFLKWFDAGLLFGSLTRPRNEPVEDPLDRLSTANHEPVASLGGMPGLGREIRLVFVACATHPRCFKNEYSEMLSQATERRVTPPSLSSLQR
jgi:hypothetical protein